MTSIVQNIPFLRLTLALVAGILTGALVQSYLPFSIIVLLLCLFTAVLIMLNRKYSFRYHLSFGIGVHFVFLIVGIAIYLLYNQKPVFYNHGNFYAEILEILQEKPNSYQSVLRIKVIANNDSVITTNEKMMTYFEKTKTAEKLKPGEVIIFNQPPQFIQNNNNPYEFDYKYYMARRNIYRQVYLSKDKWRNAPFRTSFSLNILAEKTRLHLMNIYRAQNIGEKEFDVLSALTLGYKRGLDPDTKRIFSSAGAMHVLAVSGLHVGIIFLVIKFLFGFLRNRKIGRVVYVFTAILALWSFAFIAGLSPSVKRAATMFTFMVIGESIKRHSGTYNALAASAFFLLLLNPNNLFEAGFQLSYSAVFGIVFLQPRLAGVFHFSYKVPRFFWGLLTVSVAAQIATFPATAFYFNQFPAYFWLSNLLVIPAVMILIPLGFGLLLFHWVPVIADSITVIVEYVLIQLIQFLTLIENLPGAVAEFTLSVAELFFLLGALFCTFLFIETKQKKFLKGMLVSLILFSGTTVALNAALLFHQEIIVYNHSDITLIHLIRGRKNYVVSDKNFEDAGFALNSVENTLRRLRLDEPVCIRSQQDFQDDFLFLKNGLIVFNDKIISLKMAENEWPQNITPVIAINSPAGTVSENSRQTNLVIVSSSRFPNRSVRESENIFYLREKGAFREKW